MIGTRAFLLELPLLVVPLLMLSAVAAVILRSRKIQTNVPSGTFAKVRGLAPLLIMVLLLATGATRLVRQAQHHSVLRGLQADSVDWIQVGATRLDKTGDVGAVVIALRDNQWYKPTGGDGGRAQSVNLLI